MDAEGCIGGSGPAYLGGGWHSDGRLSAISQYVESAREVVVRLQSAPKFLFFGDWLPLRRGNEIRSLETGLVSGIALTNLDHHNAVVD